METEDSAPALRFKRRKITHPKRVRLDDDAPLVSASMSPESAAPMNAKSPPETEVNDESISNLKEILRNRKRPRDRLREVARRAEDTKLMVLAQDDVPKGDQYANRFVAQTGQVVDRDDKQMTEYVEARMAEKNYRQYGWPIPKHLEASVSANAPDIIQATSSKPFSVPGTPTTRAPNDTRETHNEENTVRSHRLAAGMGKLQEVDLGPDATTRNIQRTEKAWKQLEGGQVSEEEPTEKVRLGRDGKPRRKPKRRNSEDIRRDQLVEAVLREAKLDYFDEEDPSAAQTAGAATEDNDEAMVERFRLEFLESIESRQQQRKPPQPSGGAKGAKEPSKGPKLGGSRSARAAMRLQEEQAAKNKR